MTEARNQGTGGRRVVANISLSLDGRVNGPGGDFDMGWVTPHAVSDTVRDHMSDFVGPATTALMGRKNSTGFHGFWPAVADDPNADPRDRAFARWLNQAEKVVFSTTLDEPGWDNARVVDADPATVVKDLRRQEGGDILVVNSSSLIRALLAADEIDRLTIVLCPEVSGDGLRLFEDGLPGSSWRLSSSKPAETGAVCLVYDRAR